MATKSLALLLTAVKTLPADACIGPGCWSCDAPYQSTTCVKSSWHAWKGHRDRFQAKCHGNLVRWGDDSGVQDCGVPCFACSFIRACCDSCKTISKVEGEWEHIRCSDVETEITYEYGVSTTETSAWSRTEEWSTAVSAMASASGKVKNMNGSLELSAEARHSLTEFTSGSWSQTRTEKTVEKYTQPARTCSWHWKTTITDTCGVKVARSRDFILTKGPSRGNAPCCLPGISTDSDGKCMPNNVGEVVSLCDDGSWSASAIEGVQLGIV